MINAGPRLVREVARTLAPRGIPVMPLKGVLLQRLVYGVSTFRPISDVDILVPPARFLEAHAALVDAGFEHVFWEEGRWQATLKNPGRLPLGIDLHRDVSRTPRSGLTPEGLFGRSKSDESLFGIAVRVPAPCDLFAHVLLHAMLHWLRVGRVHRPEDFSVIAASLSLDEEECARHLADLHLTPHALVFLPMTLRVTESQFVRRLLARAHAHADFRSRCTTRVISSLLAGPDPGIISRRLAGLSLAPSLREAIKAGLTDRARSMLRGSCDEQFEPNRETDRA